MPLVRHKCQTSLDDGIGVPMLTKLALALIALAVLFAQARADCARTWATCEWSVVEEWLAQQRADAEARARTCQLFGRQPSPARIEEVPHWLDDRR
jgi:hypothetical protein